MKFAIVVILLIIGFFFINKGIDFFQSPTKNVGVLGLEINASEEGGLAIGIICFVLGIAALLGSYFTWKRE